MACIGDRIDRLVLDLDELGGVTRCLARLGDHRDDRLADKAHLADRERVVLHVRTGHGRDLEERVGQGGDLLAGERPVDPRVLLRGGDVDRRDVRVGVRRADEMEVTHPVRLDVVDEDALALDEAAVLLAGDALAGPGLLRLLDLLRCDGRAAGGHSDAAFTASKMFQ